MEHHMFWDGDRWVDERAYQAAARRALRKLRDPVARPADASATGIVILALVALFALGVPLVGAVRNATGRRRFAKRRARAGSVVDVTVSGLSTAESRDTLTWDGTLIPGSEFRASRDGVARDPPPDPQWRSLARIAFPSKPLPGLAGARQNAPVASCS